MSKTVFRDKITDVEAGKTTLTTSLVSYLKDGRQLTAAILSTDGKLQTVPF